MRPHDRTSGIWVLPSFPRPIANTPLFLSLPVGARPYGACALALPAIFIHLHRRSTRAATPVGKMAAPSSRFGDRKGRHYILTRCNIAARIDYGSVNMRDRLSLATEAKRATARSVSGRARSIRFPKNTTGAKPIGWIREMTQKGKQNARLTKQRGDK